jgi:hypothetical protein
MREQNRLMELATEIVLEIAVGGVDLHDYLDIQDNFTDAEREWVTENWEWLEGLANSDDLNKVVKEYVKENWK